jgi:tetratricopeptide (TPR) repeat protein
MQLNKFHIILIISLLSVSGVLIYLNFRTPEADTQAAATPAAANQTVWAEFNYESYEAACKDSLPVSVKFQADSLEALIKADSNNYQAASQLARLWDAQGFRLIAAGYLLKIAGRLGDERSWLSAGLKYYDIARMSEDTARQVFAQKQAIGAFEKVIALNENNIDAKNALAICLVQNDLDVMRGVQLLKDVVKRDSNNVEANLTLAMLSERSGQLDKARARFEKLVQIQPLNPEYYFYLGEIYAKLEMKQEAIKTFETCITLLPDEAAKKEVQQIVENIKKGK